MVPFFTPVWMPRMIDLFAFFFGGHKEGEIQQVASDVGNAQGEPVPVGDLFNLDLVFLFNPLAQVVFLRGAHGFFPHRKGDVLFKGAGGFHPQVAEAEPLFPLPLGNVYNMAGGEEFADGLGVFKIIIGKDAVVKNSIIMQGSTIGEGANLDYVITDKNVLIKDSRILMGFATYPVFIAKGSIV